MMIVVDGLEIVTSPSSPIYQANKGKSSMRVISGFDILSNTQVNLVSTLIITLLAFFYGKEFY